MINDAKDGLGLGKLGGFDLSSMLEPAEARFLEIDIGLIKEDGENPRGSFDPATLEEMADTIRARGVITPISVRPDPEGEGRYIVNHGHRRLRAAKLAQLSTIPAVIDDSFKDEDRIIENIQRDNLDMFDVARFIAKKLSEGFKQKDVAKLIGKSTAYVSHHVQLLELPPHTDKAVRGGRLTDVTCIADLAKTEKQYPDSVALFLAGDSEVTRSSVRKFRDTLNRDSNGDSMTAKEDEPIASKQPWVATTSGRAQNTPQESGFNADNRVLDVPTSDPEAGSSPGIWRHGLVIVELNGQRGVLMLNKRPRNETYVWVEWEDEPETEVNVSKLHLIAVVTG